MSSSVRGKIASDHLDMIRGLAALAVLIGHARSLFFVDFDRVQNPGPVVQFLYCITGFGHESVMIFFVLSGLLISASVRRDVEREQWSWRTYSMNRCTRLYVVLLPGLLLTALWDRLGMLGVGGAELYSGNSEGTLLQASVQDNAGWPVFLGNLVFLQTVLVPEFGSNGPLWSLANEFWYYVLFPCVWLPLCGNIAWWKRLGYLVGSGALLAFLGRGISLYFSIWLVGVVVGVLPRAPWLAKKRNAIGTSVLALALFVGVLLLARFKRIPSGFVADCMVAGAFALFLYILLHQTWPSRNRGYSRAACRLAGCSYTLYLLHLPLLVFCRASLGPKERWDPELSTVAMAGGVCALVWLYAFVIARATEGRTDAIRRALSAWWSRGRNGTKVREGLIKGEAGGMDARSGPAKSAEGDPHFAALESAGVTGTTTH
jgi:peptidoglycan/LPS O-acetylase OafA/YrhL